MDIDAAADAAAETVALGNSDAEIASDGCNDNAPCSGHQFSHYKSCCDRTTRTLMASSLYTFTDHFRGGHCAVHSRSV